MRTPSKFGQNFKVYENVSRELERESIPFSILSPIMILFVVSYNIVSIKYSKHVLVPIRNKNELLIMYYCLEAWRIQWAFGRANSPQNFLKS